MADLNFADMPALAAPPGVIPNFVNPHSRAYQTQVAAGVCLPIMLCAFALRMYSKLAVSQSWGADDWACTLAVAASLTFVGLSLSILGHPLGPHQWNVRVTLFDAGFLQRSLTATAPYSVAAAAFKSSILLLYFRLFKPSRVARYMIVAGVTIIILFYLSCIVGALILCIPRRGEGGWTSQLSQTRCDVPNAQLSLVQGIFSTVSDFFVLTIPLHIVWGLNLPLHRKVGVSAIFLTGLLACCCSLASLVYRVQFNASQDISWNAIPVYIWSFAEVNIGIAAGSMPVLAPMFRDKMPKGFSFPSLRYLRSRFASSSINRRLAEEGISQEQLSIQGPRYNEEYVELGSAKHPRV